MCSRNIVLGNLGNVRRPMGGEPRLDTVQAGTFWGVPNISLGASGTQLGLGDRGSN